MIFYYLGKGFIKVQFNVRKRKFIYFGFNLDTSFSLMFHFTTYNVQLCYCQAVEEVKPVKYLGILLY